MQALYVVALVGLCGMLIQASAHHDPIPKWKLLFEEHHKWTGYYQRFNRPTACNIVIHSVAQDKNGVSYVTFRDKEGARMDFNVFSADDHVVTMKKSTSYNNTENFPVDQDFMANGVFERTGSVWKYKANITIPKDKGFQTLHLKAMSDATSDVSSPYTKRDRNLSLGLAIGIPVTLAILLVTTGILIGVWAIKKGYLRHVPRAYKNFRNPRDTPQVTYDRREQNNVHM